MAAPASLSVSALSEEPPTVDPKKRTATKRTRKAPTKSAE